MLLPMTFVLLAVPMISCSLCGCSCTTHLSEKLDSWSGWCRRMTLQPVLVRYRRDEADRSISTRSISAT